MTDNKYRLSPEEAQREIRGIATYADVIPSNHCFFDSLDQRNYTTDDLYFVLKNGKVREQPEWNIDHSNWQYKVEGKAIEGDEAVVITVIISHRELLAVTIMPKKEV